MVHENIKEAFIRKLALSTGLSEAEVSRYYEQAEQGCTLAGMFGITQESLDAAYSLAHRLYTSGRYNDATILFRTLCQYKDTDGTYWTGLGACLEQSGEPVEAAFCYARAADVDSAAGARPLYLLAQCLRKSGNDDAAGEILHHLLRMQYDDPGQQHFQHLAEASLAGFRE